MKIRFDNVNFNANNGPNGFGIKLAKEFLRQGHDLVSSNPDVQLSFIQKVNEFNPCVLRLDGIYFNSDQDWKAQNEQIRLSYLSSQAVIVQSEFNKELVFNYFGKRSNVHVVSNGTDLEEIGNIQPLQHDIVDKFENIWMCASHWRPHKRLNENIQYYLEHKKQNDCLLICGKGFQENVEKKYLSFLQSENIFYLGELNWIQLISCMKVSKYFLHLAFLDHCPNVVVDAKATNCICIVSSSGGTKELCDNNDVIILDLDWDFKPLKLYDPYKLNFKNKTNNKNIGLDFSINKTYTKYFNVLKSYIKGEL